MGKKKPYARERPVTVAFRMSEEAARRLDALVSLSGLTKQDYIECRLTNQSVTVYPSSRIARSLSCWMQSIYRELLIAREEGRMLLMQTYFGLRVQYPNSTVRWRRQAYQRCQ